MKKFRIVYLVLACALLLLPLFLTSCQEEMTSPATFTFDRDTQTLRWNKVVGAYAYEIRIDGAEQTQTTKANYISLEYLLPGKYTVEVRTVGRDVDMEPSAWASTLVTRDEENGLKYRLINNRTEYEVIGAGTAFGDVVMTDDYRGKPITSIADKAFSNNKKITSLVMGNKIKTIGKNAFTKCSELTSITLSQSLVSIGEYAFQSCKQLTSIEIPAGVTEIQPYTFSWCSGLESVTATGSIKSIGEYAFSNCEALVTATLSDFLISVGEYAFSDCKALTAIDLGKSIETIDSFAFSNCAAAKTLNLGESLISVGEAAFLGCSSLTEVLMPETTQEVGKEAFNGCTNIAKVTIGKDMRHIGVNAFLGTKLLEDADDLFYIDGFVILSKDTSIKELKLKAGTYGIADHAFAGCNELTRINLEGIKYVGSGAFGQCEALWDAAFDDALVEINSYAFTGCAQLTDVYLGANTKSLGDYAFLGCTRLFKMDLPDSLISIGTYCFNGTSAFNSAKDIVYIDDWAVGIKEGIYRGLLFKEGTRGIANYCCYKAIVLGGIDMPDTVEYIGRSAFYNSSYTTAFRLPANLKSIGDYAFYGCTAAWFGDNGTTVIPSSTEYIGRSAFYNCMMMVGVTIPGSVKNIGPYAFYGCVNLGDSQLFVTGDPNQTLLKGDIIIGEGVESIGDRAFQGCIGIAEINLPNSLTHLGTRAFYKCENLRAVTVGSGITHLPDYAFYKCALLESVTLSDGMVSIGRCAFRGCEKLKSLTLSKDLTSIGKYAFYGCSSLRSVQLPAGLTEIGDYAFRGCSKLNAIHIPASVETIGKHAFYGMDRVTIFCEADSIPAYWHERWNTSYRALFWGCELSEEGYVVSFTKTATSTDNLTAPDARLAPTRAGYTFMGWALTEGSTEVAYEAKNVESCPDGTVLYAVWAEGEEVEEEETEAETEAQTEVGTEITTDASSETTN